MTPFVDAALGAEHRFDLCIVSVSSEEGARWWRQRLAATAEQLVGGPTRVVVVVEAWEGGAGNALGTLHAVERADEQLADDGLSVASLLQDGARVGLWHTAGRGQRLYPLVLSHRRDKSRTLVPGVVRVDGLQRAMRLLEAVLRQCTPLARPGHLGVFWGDQLALPTEIPAWPSTPVALLGRPLQARSEEDFRAQGLSAYGLLLHPAGAAGAVQLEKLSAKRFVAALEQLGSLQAAYASLGSFSLHADLLASLTRVHAAELAARRGRLDTDPHWWMPLTVPTDVHGFAVDEAQRARLLAAGLGSTVLGVCSLDADTTWLDFGTVPAWFASCRAVLTNPSLRALLSCPEPDERGVVIASQTDGKVVGSVLMEARGRHLCAKDGVVAGCYDHQLRVQGGLAYGLLASGATVSTGEVVAGDGRGGAVRSDLSHDPKEGWEQSLRAGQPSWAELERRLREA